MTAAIPKPVLVAGCGNVLAGDDAFGILVLRQLAEHPRMEMELLDLSTNPMALLDHLPGRSALLIVDAAVAPGRAAGEILDLDFLSPDRPQLLSERAVSTHAMSIAQQIELARALRVRLPACIRLVALTIVPPELGQPPGDRACQRIAQAADLIVDWAKRCAGVAVANAHRYTRQDELSG